MRLRLRENFDIVVNGLEPDFGGEDQRKRKRTVDTGLSVHSHCTRTRTINGTINKSSQ